jgi:hypothetical protein
VPADARDFAALADGVRIAAGATLPAPSPVFPRYVEPADEDGPGTAAPKPKGGKAKKGKPSA